MSRDLALMIPASDRITYMYKRSATDHWCTKVRQPNWRTGYRLVYRVRQPNWRTGYWCTVRQPNWRTGYWCTESDNQTEGPVTGVQSQTTKLKDRLLVYRVRQPNWRTGYWCTESDNQTEGPVTGVQSQTTKLKDRLLVYRVRQPNWRTGYWCTESDNQTERLVTGVQSDNWRSSPNSRCRLTPSFLGGWDWATSQSSVHAVSVPLPCRWAADFLSGR